MKKTWHIARNELYYLFYSPIAWIMITLFMVLTGIDYLTSLDGNLVGYELTGESGGLTSVITSDGYFVSVIENLYIFLPLLTMGLICREFNNGTVKLLYSSPVKIRQIVLGKYLAICCFCLCLLALLSLTLVALTFSIDNVDYGQLAGSMFGMFLIFSTYAAIGLFVSSLTAYQVVAAIVTLVIFAFLNEVGTVLQDVDIVRDITYYMTIGRKTGRFKAGFLNTRDLFYFLTIIGCFLMFTIFKLKSYTESVSRLKKASRYIAVIAAASIIGYITSRPALNIYWDTTRDKAFTISSIEQRILGQLNEGELTITAYANLLEGFGQFRPQYQNARMSKIWEPYIRFKPDININFVYYYDADTSSYLVKSYPDKTIEEIAIQQAESYNFNFNKVLSPEQVKKQVDIKAEENRSFFVLEYKGRKAVVRVFKDQMFWPSAREIAAGLNRLVTPSPKIVFLQGEIERGPFSFRARDYKHMATELPFRKSLINHGFDFDTISLDRVSAIPTDIAALVIADPRTPFSEAKLRKINEYIDAGGNLYLLAEPGMKEITRPLLEKLHVKIKEGMIIEPTDVNSSHIIHTEISDTAKKLTAYFTRRLLKKLHEHGDPVFRVAMVGPSVLEYGANSDFTVFPLLTTNAASSWNRIAPIVDDSLLLKVSRQPGDESGSFVTALRMTRNINGKEQRIIVTSDADFPAESELGFTRRRYNDQFSYASIGYFSYGKFPADLEYPPTTDNSFRITSKSIPIQKIIFNWVIPGLIVLAGTVILIRRKRK